MSPLHLFNITAQPLRLVAHLCSSLPITTQSHLEAARGLTHRGYGVSRPAWHNPTKINSAAPCELPSKDVMQDCQGTIFTVRGRRHM